MTFTEAAVEVLRLAGKPLHYKKITEIAIERNLLSHVGKTPEITMSSRLATMVKKDRGDAPIIKVKPGVFGLRDFPEDVLESAEAEPGGDVELPEVELELDEEADEAEVEAEAPTAVAKAPSRPLPGADVFPEEEDDDEPILANLDEEPREREGGDEAGRRRKRRRRRRGGRPEEGEETVEAEGERPGRGDRRPGGEGGRGRDGGRGGNGGRGGDGGRGRDGRGSPPPRVRERELQGNWEREPAETDAVGRDLADAIEAALRGGDGRNRQPLSFARVAEQLVRTGRLGGDPASLAPTIAASIRSDSARRAHQQARPRFRMTDEGVALTDWALPPEAVAAEKDAARATTRQRQQVHRAFVRKLSELPAAGLMEILATWLNAEGVVALRAVRRNGTGGGDFHLAGTLRRGPEEVPVAIVVCRDGQLGRERVVDVRGALHHYGNAREAWMISLGAVLSGAREEASTTGAAPCALFDGGALAAAMEERGVGLRRYQLPVVDLDLDLLDSLRGPGRVRDRGREMGRGAPEEALREGEGEAAPPAETTTEGEAPTPGGEREGGRGRRRRRGRRGGDRGRPGGLPSDAEESEASAPLDAEGESDAELETTDAHVSAEADEDTASSLDAVEDESRATDDEDAASVEGVTPEGDESDEDDDEILVTGGEDEEDDDELFGSDADVVDDGDEDTDDELFGTDDEGDDDENDDVDDDEDDDRG